MGRSCGTYMRWILTISNNSKKYCQLKQCTPIAPNALFKTVWNCGQCRHILKSTGEKKTPPVVSSDQKHVQRYL